MTTNIADLECLYAQRFGASMSVRQIADLEERIVRGVKELARAPRLPHTPVAGLRRALERVRGECP